MGTVIFILVLLVVGLAFAIFGEDLVEILIKFILYFILIFFGMGIVVTVIWGVYTILTSIFG
jgi:hypothetical protein